MLYNRNSALALLSRAGGTTLPRGGPALSRARGTRLPNAAGSRLPGSDAAFYASVSDPTLRAALRALIQESTTPSLSPAPPTKVAAEKSPPGTVSGSKTELTPPAVAKPVPAKQETQSQAEAAPDTTPASKDNNERTATPTGTKAVTVAGVRRSLSLSIPSASTSTNSTDASGAVVAKAPDKAPPPIAADAAPEQSSEGATSSTPARADVNMIAHVHNRLGRVAGSSPAAPAKTGGRGGARNALAVVSFGNDEKGFEIVSKSIATYGRNPDMKLTTPGGKNVTTGSLGKYRSSVTGARLNGKSVHVAIVSSTEMEKLKASATLGAKGVYVFGAARPPAAATAKRI